MMHTVAAREKRTQWSGVAFTSYSTIESRITIFAGVNNLNTKSAKNSFPETNSVSTSKYEEVIESGSKAGSPS